MVCAEDDIEVRALVRSHFRDEQVGRLRFSATEIACQLSCHNAVAIWAVDAQFDALLHFSLSNHLHSIGVAATEV